MSYTATIYCNDPKIGKTTAAIPATNGGTNYYHYYYNSSNPTEAHNIINLADGWTGTFSVSDIAEGYSFYRWVYRIGGSDATVRYKYTSEFEYSSGDNLIIRAESCIKPWTWSDSYGNATDLQVTRASRAIRNNGDVSDFSYIVWNDLVTRTLATYDFTGGYGWKSSPYGSYDNTLMTASNRKLTAARFNALRSNIDRICDLSGCSTTGIGIKYKGDRVIGSDFITLTTCLSECIKALQDGNC